MPSYPSVTRYRADLIDVAWAKEEKYGINPLITDLAARTFQLGQSTSGDTLWGQWGLVTGGIDLPNPTYEWTPFFGLGVLDRNMMFPVQGRERLEGRIGTVLLCHDSSRLFLEQCFGLIFNAHNLLAADGTYNATTVVAPAYTTSSGTASITNTTFTISGKTYTALKPASSSVAPIAVLIVSSKLGTTPDRMVDSWGYIGYDSTATQISVFMDYGLSKAGWNGIVPPGGSLTKYSAHSITRESYNNAVSVLGVTKGTATGGYSFVRPTLVQPSFMIGARFRADDGSNFTTNYTGCKVSRVVFNFEEGNPVNYGVDFIAQDMKHNIGQDDGTGSASKTHKYVAKWSSGASISKLLEPELSTNTRVTEQPYFFSRVTLSFNGQDVARFRRFSLTVDNQLDPRYYLTQNETGSPIEGRQILTEILEGRRNISFSGSIDMDDDAAAGYPAGDGNPTDAQFVRYLLNQSFNDADIRDMAILKGIQIKIILKRMSARGTNGTASGNYPYDKITFSIPGYTQAPAQDRVGMVLRSASMNVPAPPSIHVPIDIDGFASSVDIRIDDAVA